MQFCRQESYDTQDTLRDKYALKHIVTLDLSQEDQNVSPQRHQKPSWWTPQNISVSRTYSLSSDTDGGFDSLNTTTTDGGFEVDYPADGLDGKDSLALDIVPKYDMTITPLPFWDEMSIPRSSSRTMQLDKYWTKRRKRLAFLIAACLIVVMVCSLSLVFVGRKEQCHDCPDGNFIQANTAEDAVTTAPSDPDVSFVAPTAAPMTTAAPVWLPTASPISAPDYFLNTTLAFQVLAPKVENSILLLMTDTAQGKALKMLVDEQSTYNWTPFRIVQRYALMVLYLSSGGDTWNWNQGWRGFRGDECEWHGIDTCQMQTHGEAAVNTMGLNANNMVGSIPSEICLLDLMQKIDWSENAFQGELPACIASMPSLDQFDADNNQLSGSLPTGPWPVIESLALSNNGFSGDLSSISSMPFLRNLDVHNNEFSGGLPQHLFEKFVEKLDFSNNQLSGSLHVLFVELNGHGTLMAASTLHVLRLHDNMFQGEVVGQLFFFLGQLQELTMQGNLLTGTLDGECERSLDILTADCLHVSCACCTACPEEH